MFGRLIAVGLLCLVPLLFSPAQGALSVFWRHNPITPQAIANDPTLTTKQSWSVMVSYTDSYWKFAGIRLTLPPGNTFYRNPLGGSFLPTASQIAANPALEFHTYVTTPHHIFGNHIPATLGGFPENQPPQSFGGPDDPIPGTLAVSWGNPEAVNHPTPFGTYEILRATFPGEVLPSVHPASYTSTINPDQTELVANVPEPGGLKLIVGLLFALSCRFRSFCVLRCSL